MYTVSLGKNERQWEENVSDRVWGQCGPDHLSHYACAEPLPRPGLVSERGLLVPETRPSVDDGQWPVTSGERDIMSPASDDEGSDNRGGVMMMNF